MNFAPLFGHQYSHVWIDFRGIRTTSMARQGARLLRELATRDAAPQRSTRSRTPDASGGYGRDVWGLTACDGPGDANAHGGRPAVELWGYSAARRRLRGTSATTARIAPTRRAVVAALRAGDRGAGGAARCGERVRRAPLWRIRFLDAFNPSVPDGTRRAGGPRGAGRGLVRHGLPGHRPGPILAMIENHRSGSRLARDEAQPARAARPAARRLPRRMAGSGARRRQAA